MSGSLRKWADEHQYDAEPQPATSPNSGVLPTVQLLHMQDDPLGVLAAQNAIYKGRVIRHLREVTDDMRREALDDMMKTTLQSPLEAIKMHWLVEGVDRSFTHQMVRQRTANYGQESLRFAVLGPLREATTLPPELHGTERSENVEYAIEASYLTMINSHEFHYATQAERNRAVWDWCIEQIDAAYHYLAEHGVAAEEARGLLPHATATRIHYQCNLRDLKKLMGERLCTQAQFHWKYVAALMRDAVRNYTPDFSWAPDADAAITEMAYWWEERNRWQFELIADSGIFQPVCYQTGRCMFQASANRGCTIRERVEEFAAHGVPSSQWSEPVQVRPSNAKEEGLAILDKTEPYYELKPINPAEWLFNPAAARR